MYHTNGAGVHPTQARTPVAKLKVSHAAVTPKLATESEILLQWDERIDGGSGNRVNWAPICQHTDQLTNWVRIAQPYDYHLLDTAELPLSTDT